MKNLSYDYVLLILSAEQAKRLSAQYTTEVTFYRLTADVYGFTPHMLRFLTQLLPDCFPRISDVVFVGKHFWIIGGLVPRCSSSPRPHYLANGVLEDCINPQLYGSFLWMTFMSASRTYYPVVKFQSISRGQADEFYSLECLQLP